MNPEPLDTTPEEPGHGHRAIDTLDQVYEETGDPDLAHAAMLEELKRNS